MSHDQQMIAALAEVIDDAARLLRRERSELALELLDSVSQTLERSANRRPQALPPGEGEAA
jgi:hypothetical protein